MLDAHGLRGQHEVAGAVCIIALCLVDVLLEGNRGCPVSKTHTCARRTC